MKRIFQLLGRRWKACLVIFALLLLQAWCDLSLPGYTSDIVDVGIQMRGIESTVPETVRTDTLQALEWLMPQEDAQQVEAAFSPADENGRRTLTATGADRDALEEIFTAPDMVLYAMAAGEQGADAAGLDGAVQSINSLPGQLADMAGTCARACSRRWSASPTPRPTASPPPASSPAPPTTSSRSRRSASFCCGWCSMPPSWASAA